MRYIKRALEDQIHRALKRNKSILLLGPRQTGKTTMIKKIQANLSISLTSPSTRIRYEKEPNLLQSEIEAIPPLKNNKQPLIVVDEIQKAPRLLDVAQDLIDRSKARFILTGSSARKLKTKHDLNLLPGKVVSLRLDPFSMNELSPKNLTDSLLYGTLPGICATRSIKDKEIDLESYVTLYLEDEIRSEALVRNLASFARFLELAASESGKISNLRKISQEIGVAHTTIASYYDILEDCMIAERIEPFTKSNTRKKLTKSAKYIFFDLGVRRIAAREGTKPTREHFGHLFEQFIGLELTRLSRTTSKKIRIWFWRDPDGPKVDWIIQKDNLLIPIEVKYSDIPRDTDTRHLQTFLSEYKNRSSRGYIVCQTPRKAQITKQITAIPWQDLPSLIT